MAYLILVWKLVTENHKFFVYVCAHAHKTAARFHTFWITVNMNAYTGRQMSACKKLFSLLVWSWEMSPKKQTSTFISKANFSTQIKIKMVMSARKTDNDPLLSKDTTFHGCKSKSAHYSSFHIFNYWFSSTSFHLLFEIQLNGIFMNIFQVLKINATSIILFKKKLHINWKCILVNMQFQFILRLTGWYSISQWTAIQYIFNGCCINNITQLLFHLYYLEWHQLYTKTHKSLQMTFRTCYLA